MEITEREYFLEMKTIIDSIPGDDWGYGADMAIYHSPEKKDVWKYFSPDTGLLRHYETFDQLWERFKEDLQDK